MANPDLEPLTLDLSQGFVDGLDEDKSHVMELRGFECRRGYPRSVYGRQKLTDAEIISTKRTRDVKRWVRADGTVRYYALINGIVREGTAATAYATPRSELFLDYTPSTGLVRAVTASRSSSTVTFAGTYPKALLTLQAVAIVGQVARSEFIEGKRVEVVENRVHALENLVEFSPDSRISRVDAETPVDLAQPIEVLLESSGRSIERNRRGR